MTIKKNILKKNFILMSVMFFFLVLFIFWLVLWSVEQFPYRVPYLAGYSSFYAELCPRYQAGIRIMTAALGDLRRVPDAYHLFCILWREGSRRTVNSMDEKKSLSLLQGPGPRGTLIKKDRLRIQRNREVSKCELTRL